MNQANAESGADRRNYFRIQDNVILRYRVLPAHAAERRSGLAQERPLDRFSVAASFAARSHEMRPLLNAIATQLPDVSRYLSALDEKLNEVAQLLMLQELEGGDDAGREVSLGAGGIGFISQAPLPEHSRLELRLLLPSSLLGLRAVGTVVRCDDAGAGHWVAVEFTEIREQDRDLLLRHLLGRQLSERREQRDSEDTGRGS